MTFNITKPNKGYDAREYDIIADQSQLKAQLTNSPEVNAITLQINMFNNSTITSFGSKIFNEISQLSNELEQCYANITPVEKTNKNLNAIFNANINLLHQLELYIMAGEKSKSDIEGCIKNEQAAYETTPEPSHARLKLNSLHHSKNILMQRLHDLKLIKNITIQSIVMIQKAILSNDKIMQMTGASTIHAQNVS